MKTFRARLRLLDIPADGKWATARQELCRMVMEIAPVRVWVMEDLVSLHVEGAEVDVRKVVSAFQQGAEAHGGRVFDAALLGEG